MDDFFLALFRGSEWWRTVVCKNFRYVANVGVEMDKFLLQVFQELKALAPEQLAQEISNYKDDPLAITLQFLDVASRGDVVVAKSEVEIYRSEAHIHLNDEDLHSYEWIFAANDERFTLAA